MGEPSIALKKRLDVIDRVSSNLRKHAGSADRKFVETILDEIPQFVVVGAQSAGKSSTLTRISNVPLPTASGTCTRVAMQMTLRHRSLQAGESNDIEIILHRPDDDGSPMTLPFDPSDTESIRAAIKMAQDTAISESNYARFAENHLVEIKVTGNVPNVTLVDLPGFNNQQDKEMIEAIATKYMERRGSLIFHVLIASLDIDTHLGADVVREFASKATRIFTFWDNLESHGGKSQLQVQQLLETNLRRIRDQDSRAHMCAGYVLMTDMQNYPTADEEHQYFANSSLAAEYSHVLRFGVRELNKHIEEQVSAHINKQLPQALSHVKAHLAEVTSSLETYVEREDAEILVEAMEALRRVLKSSELRIGNTLSLLSDTLREGIHRLCLRPVRLKDADMSYEWFSAEEASAADLIVGCPIVYATEDPKAARKSEDYEVREGILRSRAGEKCVVVDSETKSEKVLNISYVGQKQFNYGDMKTDIKLVVDEMKGLRSELLADPQPIVEIYAQDFAMQYHRLLVDYVTNVRECLAKWVDDAFSSAIVSERTKHVCNRLRKQLHDAILLCEKNARDAADDIRRWNVPPLVRTSNHHYLTQLYQNMLLRDQGERADDDDSYSHIYYKVCAYLKVQYKVVTEAAQKQILLKMLVAFTEKIDVLLAPHKNPSYSDLLKLISYPEEYKIRYQKLSAQRDLLQETIREIETLFDEEV